MPAVALVVLCTIGAATHAASVFDNLSLSSDVVYLPTISEGRSAQQFLLDNSDTVSEVTVRLRRLGNPTGSLTFELWSDSGSDQPGVKVAGGDVGEIVDVTAIPEQATDYVFPVPVSGLSPNQAYWVVANYSNVNNDFGNDIGWSALTSNDAGSGGATEGHSSEDGGSTWEAYGDQGGFPSSWHQMAVVSLPAPGASLSTASCFAIFLILGFRRRRPSRRGSV